MFHRLRQNALARLRCCAASLSVAGTEHLSNELKVKQPTFVAHLITTIFFLHTNAFCIHTPRGESVRLVYATRSQKGQAKQERTNVMHTVRFANQLVRVGLCDVRWTNTAPHA